MEACVSYKNVSNAANVPIVGQINDSIIIIYYLKMAKKSQVNKSKRVNIESEDGSRSERIVIQ